MARPARGARSAAFFRVSSANAASNRSGGGAPAANLGGAGSGAGGFGRERTRGAAEDLRDIADDCAAVGQVEFDVDRVQRVYVRVAVGEHRQPAGKSKGVGIGERSRGKIVEPDRAVPKTDRADIRQAQPGIG